MSLPVIPDFALERLGEYCQLAHDKPTGFANCALKWCLLIAASLDTDTSLRRYANLDTLLKRGGGSQVAEATFTGYSRLAVVNTDIQITVDNVTNDTIKLNIATNPSWNPTSAQGIGAIVLYFDPDTTADPHDSACIPIFVDACAQTTGTGGAATPLTYVQATGGFNSGIQA